MWRRESCPSSPQGSATAASTIPETPPDCPWTPGPWSGERTRIIPWPSSSTPNSRTPWTSVQSRTGSIHFETERLGGQEFAAYTYLVPADKDPFAGLVGDPRKGTHWVARYYARRYNNNRGKIILEYREPAPEKITALSGLDAPERAWLDSFRDRARKFFIIAVPEKPLPQIEKGFAKDVRWQFLNDSILGPVFLKN